MPWGQVANVEEEALELLGTELALSCIAMLPPSQADVALLRVLGGLSIGEVAKILGKRSGAVRVLQHRALRRLASIVAREEVPE